MYCCECEFYSSCCQTLKECREHGGGKLDPSRASASRRDRAEQILIDNGIEPDEAATVLQAIWYALLDKELYETDDE